MNPIASKIAPGIAKWRKIAKVKVVKKNKLIIPRIIYGSHNDAVLICTGLHLEETSGPLTFLDPDNIKELLTLANSKKISLIIYPLINNYGLAHETHVDEKLLRRNSEGINYNDGWGMHKGAEEVEVAEADMESVLNRYNVKLALSLHEDSVCPGKGYLWVNGLRDKETRFKIYKEVKKNIDSKLLLSMTDQKGEGGIIEDSISIVDSEDEGAFEEWMAGHFGVPTVLSEAPFGESFEVRKNFHLEIIKASVQAIF